jgi:hypothetical protein
MQQGNQGSQWNMSQQQQPMPGQFQQNFQANNQGMPQNMYGGMGQQQQRPGSDPLNVTPPSAQQQQAAAAAQAQMGMFANRSAQAQQQQQQHQQLHQPHAQQQQGQQHQQQHNQINMTQQIAQNPRNRYGSMQQQQMQQQQQMPIQQQPGNVQQQFHPSFAQQQQQQDQQQQKVQQQQAQQQQAQQQQAQQQQAQQQQAQQQQAAMFSQQQQQQQAAAQQQQQQQLLRQQQQFQQQQAAMAGQGSHSRPPSGNNGAGIMQSQNQQGGQGVMQMRRGSSNMNSQGMASMMQSQQAQFPTQTPSSVGPGPTGNVQNTAVSNGFQVGGGERVAPTQTKLMAPQIGSMAASAAPQPSQNVTMVQQQRQQQHETPENAHAQKQQQAANNANNHLKVNPSQRQSSSGMTARPKVQRDSSVSRIVTSAPSSSAVTIPSKKSPIYNQQHQRPSSSASASNNSIENKRGAPGNKSVLTEHGSPISSSKIKKQPSDSSLERSTGQGPHVAHASSESKRHKIGHDPFAEQVVHNIFPLDTWQDRVAFIAKHILGGATINGFMRATTAAQRLRRQRSRQVHKKEKTDQQPEGSNISVPVSGGHGHSVDPATGALVSGAATSLTHLNPDFLLTFNPSNAKTEEEKEEVLKFECMNPRTVKKIHSEMVEGISYCSKMAEQIEMVLKEIDPDFKPTMLDSESSPKIGRASAQLNNLAKDLGSGRSLLGTQESISKIQAGHTPDIDEAVAVGLPQMRTSPLSNLNNDGPSVRGGPSKSASARASQQAETVEGGNLKGSTFRKLRKRDPTITKPPAPATAADEATATINPFDASGKRTMTKKELSYKSFEVTRFRDLKVGDFVAARLTTKLKRDYWTLARVIENWQTHPSKDLDVTAISSMSEAKRESIFPTQVMVQCVDDDKGEKQHAVVRSLILPLPRSYDEASDWCTRCRKGARVYAMYPMTSSLYCGTSVDSAAYCRGEDDIVVVEFDGDEDENGQTPQRHIPARFVTLVPQEFPAAHTHTSTSMKSKASMTSKRPSTSTADDIHAGTAPKPSKKKNSGVAKGKKKDTKATDEAAAGAQESAGAVPVPPGYNPVDFEKDLFDVFGGNEFDGNDEEFGLNF